jgi:hypothetical protein
VAIAAGLKRRRGVEALSAKDAENLGLTDEGQLFYAAEKMLTSSHMIGIFCKSPARWLDEGKTQQGVIYCH